MSSGFQTVDLTTLNFPAELLVDYVRVYQRKGQQNIGCDPAARPTAQYINDHLSAYTSKASSDIVTFDLMIAFLRS